MPQPKGVRYGGRKKGTPNKISATLKDIILESLADIGGKAYLVEQSAKNPTAYMSLIGRVLPLQVTDKGGEPVMPTQVIHEYRDKPNE